MISGRQIRDARRLLEWRVSDISARAKVPEELMHRAESVDGTPSITISQAAKIQAVFEAAGVRFGRGSGVMMLASEPHGEEATVGSQWFS